MLAGVPTDAAKQLVVAAAERAAQQGAKDNRFVKAVELALANVGLELARNVLPGERAALCVPVQIDHGAKIDPGAVLLLEHRVVIAWIEGVLRPKPKSVAGPLKDVTDVRAFKRKIGRLSANLDAVSLTLGGDPIDLVFFSEISNPILAVSVEGALSGYVTFNWD